VCAIVRSVPELDHYNDFRLNSVVGYITPKDMLAERQQEIHAECGWTLEAARKTAADSSPSKPCDEQIALRWLGARRLRFRIVDEPGSIGKRYAV
jgi:hypothetical protein